MPYDVAGIFKQAKAEVIGTFGNEFIVYDQNENLLFDEKFSCSGRSDTYPH